MPTALLICPEAPYPAVGGGPMRTVSLIRYLVSRYTLDVVLFREPGAPDPRAAFPAGIARELHVIEIPYHSRRIYARAARNLVRFARNRPPLNDRFGGFGGEMARRLEGSRYDLAVIEHFWCAPYYEQIAPHAERVVLDLHNVESAFYRSSAEAASWPASLALARFAGAARALEGRWIPRFSAVLAASEEDRARVKEIAPDAAVHVFPNTIPCVTAPAVAERDEIAFSGNLAYGPNVSAVRFFHREIWPLLRARRLSLLWRIIGKHPEGVARYVKGDPRIILAGAVEDAVEILAGASVVVVPVLAASGTRIKILEAWAAARAVVSTAAGAEGLHGRDGEHLLLAGADHSFADAIARLLDSPPERRRIGAAGRALYEIEYTWDRARDIAADLGI